MSPTSSDPGPRATRRVLMLLYHFPPLGGISMSRNVRHAQYLPRYGWQPTVMTPRDPTWQPRDPSSVELVPTDLAVIRTGTLEPGHLRRAAAMVRPSRRRPGPTSTATSERVGTDPNAGASSGPTARSAARRWLFFPDDQVGWIPFAVAAGLLAHRHSPFEVVFSTSSPISSHLAAGLIRRITGVRWVAEFRDPWVGNALARPAPWLHRRLQVKLERWIVRTADAVVFVTPSLTRMYQRRYPGLDATTVSNGYDPSERQADATRSDPSRPFTIVYTGTLDRPGELATFLAGVGRLLDRRPELAGGLAIDLFGDRSPEVEAEVTQAVADGLGDVIRTRGFVPRAEALAAVASADAALVILGAGPGMELFVGGKLYDYIGQDVQVFAMVPDGDAAAVLRDLDWGEIARPDPADVERALERLLSRPRPRRTADPARRYDRQNLAGRLAQVLAGGVGTDPERSEATSR